MRLRILLVLAGFGAMAGCVALPERVQREFECVEADPAGRSGNAQCGRH
jgi:hypothetical protein